MNNPGSPRSKRTDQPSERERLTDAPEATRPGTTQPRTPSETVGIDEGRTGTAQLPGASVVIDKEHTTVPLTISEKSGKSNGDKGASGTTPSADRTHFRLRSEGPPVPISILSDKKIETGHKLYSQTSSGKKIDRPAVAPEARTAGETAPGSIQAVRDISRNPKPSETATVSHTPERRPTNVDTPIVTFRDNDQSPELSRSVRPQFSPFLTPAATPGPSKSTLAKDTIPVRSLFEVRRELAIAAEEELESSNGEDQITTQKLPRGDGELIDVNAIIEQNTEEQLYFWDDLQVGDVGIRIRERNEDSVEEENRDIDSSEESEEEIIMANQPRPALNLPSFDGSVGNKVEAYINEMQTLTDICGWNDIVALQMMKFGLKDKAADWIRALPDDQKDTVAHLQQAMRLIYGDRRPQWQQQKDFFGRKQLPNQSVLEFAGCLREEQARTQIAEATLLAVFIEGLLPSIATNVMLADPPGFEDAVNIAVRIESVGKRETPPQGKESKKTLSAVERIAPDAPFNNAADEIEAKLDKVLSAINFNRGRSFGRGRIFGRSLGGNSPGTRPPARSYSEPPQNRQRFQGRGRGFSQDGRYQQNYGGYSQQRGRASPSYGRGYGTGYGYNQSYPRFYGRGRGYQSWQNPQYYQYEEYPPQNRSRTDIPALPAPPGFQNATEVGQDGTPYCRFHNTTGHSSDTCRWLKFKIQEAMDVAGIDQNQPSDQQNQGN